MHRLLSDQQWSQKDSSAFGLAVDHFCAHRAFEHLTSAAVAQQLYADSIMQWVPAALRQSWWPARELDNAICFAWLSAGFYAVGFGLATAPPLLAQVDAALYEQAQQLCLLPQDDSRANYYRILRYFILRRPMASNSSPYLPSLVRPIWTTME